MTNPYYNHGTVPAPNAPGSSAQIRAEFESITSAFNLLPTLSGNGYKVAMINSAGTGLVASSALQSLAITASTIDNTVIGATTRAAGNFTSLSANGTVNLGSSVTIGGGTINNTVIGGTTPAAGSFTTVAAASGFTGNLTGNVTGNLTGDVTGDVTGDLAGNVTAGSGTSTFNNVTINGTLDMNAGTTNTIINLATPTNTGDAATKGYVDTGLALKLNLSGGTMSGAIAMGTNRITGLGDPSSNQDAATKTYVDTADALKLNLSGGTMSGNIAMGSNAITGLATPSNSTDASTKGYVDTGLALKLNLAGGTMSGNIAMGTNRITGLGDPSSAQDAATKAYVDSVAQGLDVKASVRVATTANITLSGTQTIDGVAVIAGDRVLVKNQSTASQNGIYVVAAGSWSRSSDADTWAELPGAFFFVEEGTANDNSGWVCTVAAGGTLGSTSVTFEQFSGAGQIAAGAGLTKTGNTLDVGTASSSRIVVNSDNIDLATTGVSAGTYKSVTVDAYGRVTAGTNPTTLAGYGISDAYTTSQVDTALGLKLNLTGGTMSGAIAMGTSKITGLGDPTSSQDAATKTYVDTADALKLALAGGTMSGNIAMGGNRVTGLGAPSAGSDAATKTYADDGLALKLALAGGTMSGNIAMGSNKITGLADPASAQDGATKAYVDSILGSTTSAAASASAAAGSALDAANSATSAASSATSAASSASSAAATYDAFDDRYLGSKSSDPAVDNDGNALIEGALYWNSVAKVMKVYNGSSWSAAYIPASGYLPLSGGTMTGDLTLAGAPTANLHAATKKYVDDSVSGLLSASTAASTYQTQAGMSAYLTTSSASSTYLTLAGGTMTGNLLLNSGAQLRFETSATIRNAGNVILQNDATQTKFGTANTTTGGYFTWHRLATMTPGDEIMRLDGVTSSLLLGTFMAATGTRMLVDGGTDSLALRVAGNSLARIDLEDKGVGDGSSPFRYISSDGGSLVLGVANRFGSGTTGSTAHVTITSAGNAGFGTTSPGSKLDVKGTLRLSGSLSGYVGLAPAASAGSTTYTLPSSDGTSGQVLSTNGSGTLSWATAGGSSGPFATGSFYYTGSVWAPAFGTDVINISSVTHFASGLVQVTFSTPSPGPWYPIPVACGDAGNPAFIGASAVSLSFCIVLMVNSGGAPANLPFNIIVSKV